MLVFMFIALFIVGIFSLIQLKSKAKKSFNFRVLSGLFCGAILGLLIKATVADAASLKHIMTFIGMFGNAYIALLQMMVIPLVLFAMLTSIINTNNSGKLSSIAIKVISVLMVTVVISAIIGILSVYLFQIDGVALSHAVGEASNVTNRATSLMTKSESFVSKTYADYIVGFIPQNIIYMLSGRESSSTLSTVLFSMFFGYAILQVKKRTPEKIQTLIDFINATKEAVLSLIKEILKLTPIGVFSLMTVFFATTNLSSAIELTKFLAASYFAIIAMYLVHLGIIMLFGLNPRQFATKSWSVLLFGFGSRSSMAAVPLNISAQVEKLGIDEETASLSATFATSIGQNGCAGIYPAMLAVIAVAIMNASGGNIPVDLFFFLKLVVAVAISSFGIAGVGGGATFSAIAVLTIMGLDIRIAALLISIEALIDMARTALNVSDGMLAGLITAKSNKTLNIETYNAKN